MTTIKVGPGTPAILAVNGSSGLHDVRLQCEWHDSAVGVIQRGTNTDVRLNDTWVSGGQGVLSDYGESFVWVRGGTFGPTKKYCVYAGNLLTGKWLKVASLRGLVCGHSEYEAILRVMGVSILQVLNCEFNAKLAPHKKEAIQIRHCIDGLFQKCTIVNSASLGPLDYDPNGSTAYKAALAVYHASNAAKKNVILFEDCTITGHFQVWGNTKAIFRRVKFVAKDTRGISGSTAINKRTITAQNGKRLVPEVVTEDCLKGPFARLT